MVTALLKCNEQLPTEIPSPRLAPLLLALAIWSIFLVVNAWGWAFILCWLGVRVSTPAALRLRIRCETLRWLPGSLWNFGARSMQATTSGVPPATSVVSIAAELIFAIIASLTFSCICFLCFASSFRFASEQLIALLPSYDVIWVLLALTALVAVIAFVPRWWRRIRHQVVSFTGSVKVSSLSWAWAAALQLFYIGLAGLGGLALLCVITAFNGDAEIPVLAVIGANSVAWLIGLLALFAPGGIVVREGVLAAVLAVWIPLDVAISVAIVWRIVQIVGELVLLSFFTLSRPRRTLWLVDDGRDGYGQAQGT